MCVCRVCACVLVYVRVCAYDVPSCNNGLVHGLYTPVPSPHPAAAAARACPPSGDDVEAEFAEDKAADVAAELPKLDAPSLMPGWGTWSNQQREPRWMREARAKAER